MIESVCFSFICAGTVLWKHLVSILTLTGPSAERTLPPHTTFKTRFSHQRLKHIFLIIHQLNGKDPASSDNQKSQTPQSSLSSLKKNNRSQTFLVKQKHLLAKPSGTWDDINHITCRGNSRSKQKMYIRTKWIVRWIVQELLLQTLHVLPVLVDHLYPFAALSCI